ncbi:hypothetical protein MBLNU230_g4914t1 [Neophaeotheca triangularis]
MADWQKVISATGRPYYFDRNNTSNVTWDRPADYVEPDPQQAQQAAEQQAQKPQHSQEALENAWKATQNAEGKTYYWNQLSKQTTWNLPPHLAQKAQAYLPPNAAPAQAAATGYNQGAPAQQRQDDVRATNGNAMVPWGQKQEGADYNRHAAPAKIYDAEFATYEEAETAFFKLLKDNGVTPALSFVDVIKAIGHDPVYRGIKDPAQRQAALQKYQRELKEKQVNQERERKTKLKADFQRMLAKHTEIVHYTRWKTATKVLENEDAFQAISDDSERRQIFEEHIVELIIRHHDAKNQKKEAGKRAMEDMLKDMVIDPETTWADAQPTIMEDERFLNNPQVNDLHKIDVLSAFETHMTALEREANARRQQEKKIEARRARKARDQFIDLLDNMQKKGAIKPYMRFDEFVKLVADDERFTALLGTFGSSPLDLFRDFVVEETSKFRIKKNEAMDLLEEEGFEMTVSTTVDEFANVIRHGRRRPQHFTFNEVPSLFEGVMAKVKERANKERLESEKAQRHAYDDFKRDLARMRSIHPGDKYEDVLPTLTQLESFQHLDEETAKKAFTKFMRSLEEDDHDRSERRRERRRGEGHHDSRRSHRRTTHTPETDAYEAERRKAQEARERQYRNTSAGVPSPGRRDRRISGGRLERSSMPREYSGMERGGGGRYSSRADPREKMSKALDYGDEDAVGSGPSSARKRQGSQGSGRANKRQRTASANGAPQKEKELSVEYHSGSEEGELAVD